MEIYLFEDLFAANGPDEHAVGKVVVWQPTISIVQDRPYP